MATDGGLAGIALIIEPPSPPLSHCHLSSRSNVILAPGQTVASHHQSCALRASRLSATCHSEYRRRNNIHLETVPQIIEAERHLHSGSFDKSETTKRNVLLAQLAKTTSFSRLTGYVFIQTTSFHTATKTSLLSRSWNENVPITGRSSWQCFKWARTMLYQAAEWSICMTITMPSAAESTCLFLAKQET